MRRIDVEERRARLALRHRLAPSARALDALEVARSLLALHATDPSTVFLSARARMRDPTVEAIEHALYEERSLVRLLGMRRTMFVVPTEVVPVVQAGCTAAIAVGERRRLVEHLEQAEVAPDGGAWLRRVEDLTMRALAARGGAAAVELTKDVAELATRMRVGIGTKWETEQGVSTRVLSVLAAEGRIVRGRPSGSWTSGQYRWSTTASWLPAGVADIPTEVAQAELVRRWLRSFGPGTVADLKWWTGWTAGPVRRALAEVDAVEVEFDGEGGVGLVLADDVDPVAPSEPEPWVALLPSLDTTVMGWFERGWYLGGHRPLLFDRSGNPGPTVWADGRIVGGWAQRKDGEVVFRLLEDIGAEASAAVEGATGELQAWLGAVRVAPRFPTPLERELVS